VFAHLNAPWLGAIFAPDAFLQMMHRLGAFRVGHAADGGPLVPPATILKPADRNGPAHAPEPAAEGTQP
jgi:hypothetical protein